jgi:hypothetical protein
MDEQNHLCPVCAKEFADLNSLREHDRQEHESRGLGDLAPDDDEEVISPCPECGAQLESPALLEEHLVQLHPSRTGMGRAPIQEGRGSKGSF